MKETETENFKYTQKNITVGNKKRTIITINQKPGNKSGKSASPFVKMVASNNSKTITRKKCGGCSRKRRG